MASKSKPPGTKSEDKIESLDKEELLALARLDIERGDLEAALLKLKQVLVDESPPLEALSMGGRLYAQLGLWDRAKALLQRYLSQQPNAINETFQFGMVHFDSGQTAEAKKIWEGLLKTVPAHPPALFYYGLVLAQEGQIPQARQNLDTLLKSAAADNLYFGRAKELLQALEQARPGSAAGNGGERKDPLRIAPKDPYKTEH